MWADACVSWARAVQCTGLPSVALGIDDWRVAAPAAPAAPLAPHPLRLVHLRQCWGGTGGAPGNSSSPACNRMRCMCTAAAKRQPALPCCAPRRYMENADSLQDRLELVQTIVVRSLARSMVCWVVLFEEIRQARSRATHAATHSQPGSACVPTTPTRACGLLSGCWPPVGSPARPLHSAALQETASAAGHEGEPMLQCFF